MVLGENEKDTTDRTDRGHGQAQKHLSYWCKELVTT